MMDDHDAQVRAAAFRYLEEQTLIHGPDGLPWKVLAGGFDFQGKRVPLVSQQGIFKPAILDLPLSMRTTPQVGSKARPYDDELSEDGVILYRYRGTDPMHRDNAGLRGAMKQQAPLIYLYGLVPGCYLPFWPALIVNDEPGRLAFTVQIDHGQVSDVMGTGETENIEWPEDSSVELRRAYYTGAVKRRVHQQGFRKRVLRAYREQCSVCRLKHAELLDAAHIIPDNEGGRATVSNGLSLCKLHHAAFDKNILGVNPDLVIEVRQDILEEIDGPMLQHGLKGAHGDKLQVPRKSELRPDRSYLEQRYERFRKAS